jgi:flagellar biosynthesis/type III secretory pathway chaperone
MHRYASLIGVLDDLVSCHRALLEIEQEKQQLIINQDWNALQEQVERSRTVLGRIRAREQARTEVVGRMGLDPASSLSRILDSAPGEVRGELADRGRRLRELIQRLQELNRRSANLLAGSLEVVSFTLSLISGEEGEGKTYGTNGKEQQAGGRRTSLVFDLKV